MKIIKQNTKTLITRDNGRSSDAISPNFIYGCLGGCMASYCYVGRFNNDRVYINENVDSVLASIDKWSLDKQFPKIPNQVDDTYYCIDIGCSTDVPLHTKYYDWQKVFDFFNNHEKLKSTFATKYPTRFNAESYNLNKDKHRIRISLMPQKYSDILEPNTDSIDDRINTIDYLSKYMEVHINFSPIIYTEDWLKEYEELFIKLKDKEFKSECIFLTYNDIQYERNSKEINDLCWNPDIQEHKNSQYSADNIRYKWQLKNQMIQDFKNLYSKYFDLNNIRYIF
jgi:spore photoproduct lyase